MTGHPALDHLPSESDWFRLLAESAPLAIFLVREDAFLYANPASGRLFGCSADQLLSESPSRLLPGLAEIVRRRAGPGGAWAQAAGEEERAELRLVRVGGEERWVEVAVQAAQVHERPSALVSAVDVTERKRDEEALRESRERLSFAQSAARSVIWDWDIASDELRCSEHADELAGRAFRELVPSGAAFLALVHPEDRERYRAAVGRTVTEGEDLALEIRLLLPDGRLLWLAERARAVRDASGWATRVLGVARDVTERKSAELAVRESEEKYRLLVEAQTELVVKLDAAGRITFASPSLCAFLGRSEAELLGRSALGDAPAEVLRRWREVQRPPHLAHYEQRFPAAGGRCISWAARGITDADGRFEGAVAVGRDTTERKLTEAALFQEKERAQVTLASIGDAVIRTDAEGRVDYLNPVAERLAGWILAEAYGRPLEEVFRVVDEGSRQPLLDPVGICLRERRRVELTGRRLLIGRHEGESMIRDSASPLLSREGELIGAVLVFRDLTEIHGMEQEVTYLASHDALTGLLNRSEFEARVERALDGAPESGGPCALLVLELDPFRLINDSCGPLAGDAALKAAAQALREGTRPADAVARLGVDEFGVLFADRPPPEARRIADELCRGLAATRFAWDGQAFDLAVSAGLVTLGPEWADPSEALAAADAACYVAKDRGRNRLHEHQPDDAAVAERWGELRWTRRLHRALESGGLRLYRQPIRPLRDGTREDGGLSEVFVRLVEDGEVVGSSAFMPAAERYRLAPMIDRWVVANALERLGAEDLGDGVFTLNLSGQSLSDEGFLAYVLDQLGARRVSPGRICFEITETAAIANLTAAVRFISVLRERGCRFVLDDFGSGLSSFAYLKNLPVDFLKIDGEFVRNVAEDPIHRALVSSIHQIGRVMGLETIAEQVETAAALEALHEIGVDYAQGFWLGRPTPLA